MNTSASAMGATTGSIPNIRSETLCAGSGPARSPPFTSGATTSIVPMPLLISLPSPSGRQFHERAEPRLERPFIAVGVSPQIHLGLVPVGLDDRPHALVGEEKYTAKR